MLRKLSKSALVTLTAIGIAVAITGCSKSTTDEDTTGNWIRKGDFDGVARSEAVVAVVNDKAYAGLGFDGTTRLNDFWEYDVATDVWRRKADFPGVARNAAVAFSANGKVYAGLGYDGINKLKDFWEYDPATDAWKQVADFGGAAKYGATAFSIDDMGYVVAGYDGNASKELWQYDPNADTWTLKNGPGSKRYDAVAFVIDSKAYFVTGTNNGSYNNDFYVYDASTDTWTEKRKISNVSDDSYDDDYNITRSAAAAFTINGKGYVATGVNGGYATSVWEYDPSTDLWTEKTVFQGSSREGAIGFSVGGKGIIALGRSSSLRFDDVRELVPDADEEDNDD